MSDRWPTLDATINGPGGPATVADVVETSAVTRSGEWIDPGVSGTRKVDSRLRIRRQYDRPVATQAIRSALQAPAGIR